MGYPIRAGTNTATFNAGGGTTHNAALPATVLTGDRVVAQVTCVDPTTTVTTPSGWTAFGSANTGGSGSSGHVARWYYRDAAGSEGGNNVDWATSADVDVVVIYARYLAGTFASGSAPELAVVNNDTQENPPNLNPSGWASEPAAWIAGWQRFGTGAGSSTPAGTFYDQITAVSSGGSPVGAAIAFKNNWLIDQVNPGLFTGPDATNIGAFTAAIRGQAYTIPGVDYRSSAGPVLANPTTTFQMIVPSDVVAGDDLYVLAVSRDHTSGTTLATLTDDDTGGNTWTLLTNSTDRKAYLWWKKATSGTASKTVTFAGGVGSSVGGLSAFFGGASGDPTTNIVLEDNASGNETHAGFTPDEDDSMVCFGILNVGNDNVVTDAIAATLGPMEDELWENQSTGGSDCSSILFAKREVGSPTDTGSFTWAQTNGVTVSISFAIKPATEPEFVIDQGVEADTATDVVLAAEPLLTVEQGVEADVAADVVLETDAAEPEFFVEQGVEADVANDVVLLTVHAFLVEQAIEADVAFDVTMMNVVVSGLQLGWGHPI